MTTLVDGAIVGCGAGAVIFACHVGFGVLSTVATGVGAAAAAKVGAGALVNADATTVAGLATVAFPAAAGVPDALIVAAA